MYFSDKILWVRVFFSQIDIGDFLPKKKWNNTLIFMWLSLDLYFWKSIYIAGLYFHLKFGILYWNAMLCIVKGIFKKWVGGLRDFYSFSNWEFFTFVPGIHGIGSNFVRLAIYTTVVSRCAVNRSFPILLLLKNFRQIFCSRGRPVEQFYWTSSRF